MANVEHVTDLSPTQSAVFDRFRETVAAVPVTILHGGVGTGKTTLVEKLREEMGGIRISCEAVLDASSGANHPSYEETFAALIESTLEDTDIVFVDDLDIYSLTNRYTNAYPRPLYLSAALNAVMSKVRDERKKVVFTATDQNRLLPYLNGRAVFVPMSTFTADDFDFFLRKSLGDEKAAHVDTLRVWRFSSKLSIYQLMEVGSLLRDVEDVTDQTVMDLLDERMLNSNVSLGEVAKVNFDNLKGFDDIIEQLQTFVVNPMVFDARFADLDLRPKKGVLLYGPPGTGKTSIGRALAHQMGGKFFMIDGTFFTESADVFYAKIHTVFEQAKLSTPSVIFIDDADVLMKSPRLHGLNRYLLTMLDGLETETAGKIAVILTAMDPNQMPTALLRAGRVELWIETKLPDAAARSDILSAELAKIPARLGTYDEALVRRITEGFNAADIARLVADAKAYYANDVVNERETLPLDVYFEKAAAEIERTKELIYSADQGTLKTTEQRGNYYAGRDTPAGM